MDIIKKDENTITIITPTEVSVSYDDLVAQKALLQAQKDLAVYQLDKQMADIDALLAQCKVLKVTAKPVDSVVDAPVDAVPLDSAPIIDEAPLETIAVV